MLENVDFSGVGETLIFILVHIVLVFSYIKSCRFSLIIDANNMYHRNSFITSCWWMISSLQSKSRDAALLLLTCLSVQIRSDQQELRQIMQKNLQIGRRLYSDYRRNDSSNRKSVWISTL